MKKILLNGCNGKMGKVIASSVLEREDCEIIAGIDISKDSTAGFPVYTSFNDFKNRADVIIDFSHPSSLNNLLKYSTLSKTPAVIATTGLSPEQIDQINDASKEIAIFQSANMSIGISLLKDLAQKATRVLGGNFDIEIIEAHHNQKIDAPSGTALLLADAISHELETKPIYEFDRHSKRAKRDKNEIGIHAVRGGTIVGEHEIMFAGHDEIIKISHSAMSKEIFAVGALNAALYLCDKPSGIYNMSDFVASK